jgi:hypothetical protein
MSALVEAMDFIFSNPTQMGENKHIEHGWSHNIQEQIIQWHFQAVRTTDPSLIEKYKSILINLSDKPTGNDTKKNLLRILFRMIGHTRDIESGKGEYNLAYNMVWTWYEIYPQMAKFALCCFVHGATERASRSNPENIPYGSWKDMKYMCRLILEKTNDKNHPLIQYCIHLMNEQLRKDVQAQAEAQAEAGPSLLAKWIPREGSNKFGFLFELLAYDYFPRYLSSAKNDISKSRAQLKAKMDYRKVITNLNRVLDTTQIKQCAKTWASIEHAKTTSITMAKQRKAFLNKKGSDDPDRIECADNLRAHLESLKKQGKEVKGKHVALPDFTKQALDLSVWSYNQSRPGHMIRKSEEADILNSQWRDNSNKKNAGGLGPMVAMCDLSGSMEGDPLAAAIALSCRVAEKSALGRRIMTFSAEPAWINLDEKTDFTDMVMEILANNSNVGLNTDFYKALDLILSVIVQNQIPPADVENMILAIFSDMQIDDCLCFQPGSNTYAHSEQETKKAYYKWSVMHDKIKQKYAEAGMRYFGKPLKPPHILFWNLRSTTGFPTLSTEAGCSMMSGFSPALLNAFCDEGMDSLHNHTPWSMFLKLVEVDRYKTMDVFFERFIGTV